MFGIKSNSILYFIAVYLFIFQPPFISRATYFWIEIAIFIFIFIFKNKKIKEFFKVFNIELLILLSLVLFSLLRDLISGENVYFYRVVSFAFQCYVFGFIVAFFVKNRFSILEIEKLFLILIVLATFTSIFLLIFQDINDVYKSYIIINAEDENVTQRIFRSFGVTEDHTFSYPYVIGLSAGYVIYRKLNSFYLINLPFFLAAIFFNARIGFLGLIIFLIRLAFIKPIKFFLISSIFYLIFIYVERFAEHTDIGANIVWGISFFYDISNYVMFGLGELDESSNISILTGDFIVLPKTVFEILVGSGKNIFLDNSVTGNSDIGFITQVNYGGVLFSLIFSALIIFQIIKLYSIRNLDKTYVLVFIFSFLILNFKGSFLVSNPGTRFILLIYILVVFWNYSPRNFSVPST